VRPEERGGAFFLPLFLRFFILIPTFPRPQNDALRAHRKSRRFGSVKGSLVAVALFPLSAICLSAHGAASAPGSLPGISQSSGTDVCASTTDTENLCEWDSAAGTHGRKCLLDVEKIERSATCRYDSANLPDAFDHKPMCISLQQAEHIAFQSSRKRRFRVRRLVPITATGVNGQACPKHPFGRSFLEEDLTFGSAFDTLAPKAEAAGCKYKLEVQFRTIDANAPAEPHDGKGRHFECRDPHLKISSQ
jgi:hypothetical protein